MGVPATGAGGLVLGGWPAPRGVPGGDPPRWLLLWAVCILLECILVITENTALHASDTVKVTSTTKKFDRLI